MKYIPILFSTPMVQAIIEGRKMMTRRVMKEAINASGCWRPTLIKESHIDGIPRYELRSGTQYILPWFKCPYGQVGDVLWVRETFTRVSWADGTTARKVHTHYKADNDLIGEHKWRPSLFMPKAACRIFLEITEIRVERLNDISERDAINEGIKGTSFVGNAPFLFKDYFYKYPFNDNCPPKFSFQTLWQSINGKDSWEANPWVWVISFKRIEKPTDFK